MTESTLRRRLRQNRIWILLLLLLLLFAAGIIWADTLISKRLSPNFNCEASLIRPGMAVDQANTEKLRLRIATENGHARLRVSYRHDSEPWASIELTGSIKGLEPGSLSYLISLEQRQEKLQVDEAELPPYLLAMRDSINKALAQPGKLDLRLHVLEMDILADYALIQVTPGDHLWACRMSEFEEDKAQEPLLSLISGLFDGAVFGG
ncbi:hypothetical protein AYI72_05355 [Shewanella algae]|uniref:Uncharacterized protein n=1 Tax=Shewanella algae TaxID=38313 RepID=A0A379YWZ1_9GAMM|nr:hypothetical protein [Shewanella algae]MBO2606576.1 hypothetical protein [Shewanella algae]PWF93027.1 hypothetical protein DD549_05770 [Shewanella algae]QHD52323.1 hypothetical protein GM320_03655 [Shewanella algae]QXP31095.1 hypothetical protein KE622_06825 [Shewanella algae]QXP35640.1 hypothetical protein KE623_08790 [Shewanella algae]